MSNTKKIRQQLLGEFNSVYRSSRARRTLQHVGNLYAVRTYFKRLRYWQVYQDNLLGDVAKLENVEIQDYRQDERTWGAYVVEYFVEVRFRIKEETR